MTTHLMLHNMKVVVVSLLPRLKTKMKFISWQQQYWELTFVFNAYTLGRYNIGDTKAIISHT